MPQDYPDGMTRMLPGHTIDLENGFARPWYEGSSVTIAAGASGSYTLDFSDDDGIYYIDVVNVSPSAYKEFTVIIHINDVPYVCGSTEPERAIKASIFLLSLKRGQRTKKFLFSPFLKNQPNILKRFRPPSSL